MGKNCHDHKHVEIPSYWHSLDGDSYKSSISRFTAKNLSVSTPPFQNQLDALRSRIRLGVNNVELGFTGVGKGNAQSPTPGSVGIAERQAIKEVAKINDVKINSVHAPMSIEGLAGFGQRGFNEQKRAQDVEEVKRSIDFAGDVSDGGAIVVHTGEFPYSIKERFGDKPFTTKDGKKIKLSESPYASEFAEQYIVDKRGNINAAPINKNDITLAWNPEKKDFESRDLEFYKNLAKINKLDSEVKRSNSKEYRDYTDKDIDEKRYRETYENPYWLANKDKLDIALVPLNTQMREFKVKESDRKERIRQLNGLLQEEQDANRRNLLQNALNELNSDTYIDDIRSSEARIKQEYKEKLLSSSLSDYGMQKTNESVAELAIEAARVTKNKKLNKSIFIAPENLWGGSYGSHPQDLKNIIKDSRDKFVEFATKDKIIVNGKEVNNTFKSQIEKIHGKKLSQSEAKKYAKDHIKATFDIGHANIWRKYFEGSENEFKQWLGKEVKELTDEGIIGHVHVSDNFGYNDEHLPPGAGNAPIKEFMTHLEKSDYKGAVIIEPGSTDDKFPNFLNAMYDLETPIYRLHGDKTTAWTDVQGGYFGNSYIPSFVTPGYLSSVDKNTPFTWSSLPLE